MGFIFSLLFLSPMGIDAEQMRFTDCFLLYCLFIESPLCDDQDRLQIADNLRDVVNRGREPELQLNQHAGPISLKDWSNTMLDDIESIAQLLDQAHDSNKYLQACKNQRQKITNPALTPSAKILADMKKNDQPFFHFAKNLAEQHNDYFRGRPLDEKRHQAFVAASQQSLTDQQAIEQNDSISFEQYLHDYYQQYQQLSAT